ncbi:MAG: methionine adenosyltransferase domain-containing protein [Bacteroidales bacterium]|nr:methionine adenosyltransferase domain-containing protein [Bacteroidales bacterium]
MKKFAEYVSLGHPDKIADYISSYILDRYIEKDPSVKYAVEVQIKDNIVTLGGEVSSEYYMDRDEMEEYVKAAVRDIGYDYEYLCKWGMDNCISGGSLIVNSYISHQSKEIAMGLKGWGDQGLFFGYANANKNTHFMPYEHALAKRICKCLFESGICGLDIKTQVITEDDDVKKIVVAVPLLEANQAQRIYDFLKQVHGECDNIIVNGTGSYKQHSSKADCGMTGKKLAVDFYGGACRIGGGSPWTKDGTKADLTLNLYAREVARKYAKEMKNDVFVSLACCIGSQEVDYSISDDQNHIFAEGVENLSPKELIERYKLNTPIFASMCRWGLFGEFQKDKVWEMA